MPRPAKASASAAMPPTTNATIERAASGLMRNEPATSRRARASAARVEPQLAQGKPVTRWNGHGGRAEARAGARGARATVARAVAPQRKPSCRDGWMGSSVVGKSGDRPEDDHHGHRGADAAEDERDENRDDRLPRRRLVERHCA